jgi:hypothetical protein
MTCGRLSFLGAALPPEFELRVVSIAPGAELAYDTARWRDAVVVVERGEIEVEGICGGRRRFGSGAVLWLADLPLRTVRNPARGPALLSAVRRRPDLWDGSPMSSPAGDSPNDMNACERQCPGESAFSAES